MLARMPPRVTLEPAHRRRRFDHSRRWRGADRETKHLTLGRVVPSSACELAAGLAAQVVDHEARRSSDHPPHSSKRHSSTASIS